MTISGSRRVKRRWLGPALVAACTLVVLTILWAHAVAARSRPLWAIGYHRWVDGQRYSTASWRYWEDIKFAIGRYLEWRHGPPRPRVDAQGKKLPPTHNLEMTRIYHEVLLNRTRRLGIRAHEFWRTLPERPFFRRRQPYVLPASEDPGRGLVTAVFFWLLGGISPYVTMWLGPLVFVPCALWCLYEWSRSGRHLGACIFFGLLAFSPYLVESLTLPHSAVGFYLNALIICLALAFYAAGPSRSKTGFFARAAAAGMALALCALCRSGSVLLVPALGLSLLVAAGRIWGSHGWRPARPAWLAAGVSGILLTVPYLVVKPAERHAVWQGAFWAGLGDYGRDRGYSWHDRDAKRFLIKHGLEPFDHPNAVTAEQEAFFRETFLRDVTAHPVWYAGILGRRLGATLAQSKLLPWIPLGGRSVTKPIFHYKYVTPVDYFGWPGHYAELPLPLLWLSVPGLLALGGLRRVRARLRQDIRVLLLFALAPLPLPVLVSTAAGIETQAFALVYLVAFALLADGAWAWIASRRKPPPGSNEGEAVAQATDAGR
jgi:hypothetical protein